MRNVYALLAVLQPSCGGVGKLLFDGLPAGSSPILLELLGGHDCPCQLLFQLLQKEKVCRCQVRGVGGGG
jgi:hypothetical protein